MSSDSSSHTHRRHGDRKVTFADQQNSAPSQKTGPNGSAFTATNTKTRTTFALSVTFIAGTLVAIGIIVAWKLARAYRRRKELELLTQVVMDTEEESGGCDIRTPKEVEPYEQRVVDGKTFNQAHNQLKASAKIRRGNRYIPKSVKQTTGTQRLFLTNKGPRVYATNHMGLPVVRALSSGPANPDEDDNDDVVLGTGV